MTDFYELIYPNIEYVDIIRNNPRDTNGVTFVVRVIQLKPLNGVVEILVSVVMVGILLLELDMYK